MLARYDGAPNARLKEVMEAAIRHLHAFVREINLQRDEWFEAIKFLTATGHKSDDKRQEFILLSDVLGASMLVDAITHRREAGATESTVLGPFFVHGAPPLENGGDSAWEVSVDNETRRDVHADTKLVVSLPRRPCS